MATYLDRILERHRERGCGRPTTARIELIDARSVPCHRRAASPVHSAAGAELHVITEIKRRSPSKGELNADLDPADAGAQLPAGGALPAAC